MDVTPPRLSFVYAPLLTNVQVNVRWIYDEIATSSCILKSPVSTSQVDCASNEWNSSILVEGSYTLSIIGIDLANNSALAVTHSWFVGKFLLNYSFKSINHTTTQNKSRKK